ncbi:MAG: hypothetical protein KDD66_03565 [Bdellovibrionales bacterium]|nr:hypothetical protein [Bdellovibrionales bacterium]
MDAKKLAQMGIVLYLDCETDDDTIPVLRVGLVSMRGEEHVLTPATDVALWLESLEPCYTAVPILLLRNEGSMRRGEPTNYVVGTRHLLAEHTGTVAMPDGRELMRYSDARFFPLGTHLCRLLSVPMMFDPLALAGVSVDVATSHQTCVLVVRELETVHFFGVKPTSKEDIRGSFRVELSLEVDSARLAPSRFLVCTRPGVD